MEKILRIEETTFKKSKDGYSSYDGYQIITDKQTIKMGISNGQSCCEQWGYFMTEDNVKEFEGSELLEVNITDDLLKSELLVDTYDGGCMFVTMKTSKGILQFVAYNSHNGYYGHEAVIISDQLNKSESL